EVKVMSKRRPKLQPRKPRLGANELRPAADGAHPALVSGMFREDPTFEEFRKILAEQRDEDYRRAKEEIASARDGAKACSSSTPTPSRTTKTRTRSSVKK